MPRVRHCPNRPRVLAALKIPSPLLFDFESPPILSAAEVGRFLTEQGSESEPFISGRCLLEIAPHLDWSNCEAFPVPVPLDREGRFWIFRLGPRSSAPNPPAGEAGAEAALEVFHGVRSGRLVSPALSIRGTPLPGPLAADLLRWPEETLLGVRSFGPSRVKRLDAFIRRQTAAHDPGLTLASLRRLLNAANPDSAGLTASPFVSSGSTSPVTIAEKISRLPAVARRLPIRVLRLAVRTRNVLQKRNLDEIGDLTGKTEDEFLRHRGFGLKSLEDLRRALDELLCAVRTLDLESAATPEDCLSRLARRRPLMEIVEDAVRTDPEREGRVLTERTFAGPEAPSLEDMGRRLGVSRERARQLEVRALNRLDPGGLLGEELHATIARRLAGRTTPLSLQELIEDDPWLAGLDQKPVLLAALLEVAGRRYGIEGEPIEGSPFLADARALPLDRLRAKLQAQAIEMPAPDLDSLAATLCAEAGAPELTNLLRSVSAPSLVVADRPIFRPRLRDQIESVLEEAGQPLTVRQIEARLRQKGIPLQPSSVRGALLKTRSVPAGASRYVLASQLTEFERLLPDVDRAVAKLFAEDPGRQWSESEILSEMLRRKEPWAWNTPRYALHHLLKQHSRYRYLKRGFWALADGKARRRIRIIEAACRILEQAPGPLPHPELFSRIERERSLRQITIQWPLVLIPHVGIDLGPRILGLPEEMVAELRRRIVSEATTHGEVGPDRIRELHTSFHPATAPPTLLLARALAAAPGPRLAHTPAGALLSAEPNAGSRDY